MTFAELLSSVGAQIKERVGNPFVGAFALSWLTINHRYVIDICSTGQSLAEKSQYINATYFNSFGDSYVLYNCVLLPFLSAVLIIFAYPWVNATLIKAASHGKDHLKRVSAEIEGREVYTDGQLKIANAEIARLRKSLRSEIANFKDVEDENKKLTASEQKIQQEVHKLRGSHAKLTGENEHLKSEHNRVSEIANNFAEQVVGLQEEAATRKSLIAHHFKSVLDKVKTFQEYTKQMDDSHISQGGISLARGLEEIIHDSEKIILPELRKKTDAENKKVAWPIT